MKTKQVGSNITWSLFLVKNLTMEWSESSIPIYLRKFLLWLMGISDEPVLGMRINASEQNHMVSNSEKCWSVCDLNFLTN